MEQTMLWVAIISGIGIPLILGWGAWVNSTITKKIDDMNASTEKCNQRIDFRETESDRKEKDIYTAVNGQRTSFENELKDYVRKEMHDKELELHRLNNDDKFKSLLSVVVTQGTNLEAKIEGYSRNMNEKINDIKELINDKFNKQGK